MLEKVQLAFSHFLNAVVGARGVNLKRHGRHFQFIKMNGANVFIQIKGIQILKKALHIVLVFFGGAGVQPVSQMVLIVVVSLNLFNGAAQQGRSLFLIHWGAVMGHDILTKAVTKGIKIAGPSMAGANPVQVGQVKTRSL